MEQVEAHLLQDVGNIHHDPVIDNLVILIEPMPVGNLRLNLAAGKRNTDLPLVACPSCGTPSADHIAALTPI